MILVKGKRYEWTITIPSDGRMVNGLFTGRYKENGNALFLTKKGEVWSVPPNNCKLIRK